MEEQEVSTCQIQHGLGLTSETVEGGERFCSPITYCEPLRVWNCFDTSRKCVAFFHKLLNLRG